MAANIKVALVHDYLREYGDAERLLQVIHRLYPDAPLYTAFVDYQQLGTEAKRFAGWDMRTTFAQKLPGIAHPHRWRGLLPYLWENIDLSEFDLVISSSGDFVSKSVLTRAETLHVSYCHTPPRHLWERLRSHPQSLHWYDTWLDTRLRQYDFYASQRVDRYITNSHTAARRISKFYNRPAEVIPPPIKVHGEGQAGDRYYLYAGKLTRQMQVELVVRACTQLDRPLWIVGTGHDAEYLDSLRSLAGPEVKFLGEAPEEALPSLYAEAKALVFPCSSADFSREAVEAMGHGIPVIASQQSGLREVVLDYRTGILFPQPTVESLVDALNEFEGLRFSSVACIERAEEFAESVFVDRLQWFIAQALDAHHAIGVEPERDSFA
ncbi:MULTISPECIES: glycosyltransferase [Trichocoleus]|uniref:Glycosyltransferase n=1 Tax=Trichocoleus desertorum GB2-A4 TaxID=2933944 RepID=A0ABV0J543_9CYAN|nr:glycosyltransferase [Trichocoleus sp. FACHB-46]MBD1863738.1 glycosyltransferase [Trichocoleus sp. FACHB-46]